MAQQLPAPDQALQAVARKCVQMAEAHVLRAKAQGIRMRRVNEFGESLSRERPGQKRMRRENECGESLSKERPGQQGRSTISGRAAE